MFLDTSALVKRYIEEPRSDKVDLFFNRASVIFIAWTLPIEIASVLGRRLCEKTISISEQAFIEKEFYEDLPGFDVVPPSREMIEESVRLIKRHGLKSLDSIQLASFRLSGADTFLTADRRLHQYAIKDKLTAEYL